jgi:hypothetical protein
MWVVVLLSNRDNQVCKPAISEETCRSEGLTATSEEDPPSMAMTWRKEGKASRRHSPRVWSDTTSVVLRTRRCPLFCSATRV